MTVEKKEKRKSNTQPPVVQTRRVQINGGSAAGKMQFLFQFTQGEDVAVWGV